MNFAMTHEHCGAVTVLTLTGELDMSTAPQLWDRIEQLLSAGRHRIVLDLATLTFCDSAVLHVSGIDEVLAYRGDD